MPLLSRRNDALGRSKEGDSTGAERSRFEEAGAVIACERILRLVQPMAQPMVLFLNALAERFFRMPIPCYFGEPWRIGVFGNVTTDAVLTHQS